MTLTQRTANAGRLAEQAVARCRTLASFSENVGSLRRTFLSRPMRDVHREIASWLAPLGIKTRIDAVGNLRAIYPAIDPCAPRLLIGSHLDTVPNAGIYDGMLGVVLAVALLEGLEGCHLPYAIEVVGFSEEEGVRFGIPFIGSRALVGRIDDELLEKVDASGVSVRDAIDQFGLDLTEIEQAVIGNDICAYL
jgi:allantoate deiminase